MKNLLFTFLLLMSLRAEAVVNTFSYSGRLLDSNDIAVTQSGLTFQVRLKKSECVFYQESIPQNLTNTGGYFTLDVGTGASISGSLNNLYSSGPILDVNGQNCVIIAGDSAYIDIIVSGLSGSQTIDFGWAQLKNSYQGLNSLKLQGKDSTQFINTSSSITQLSLESLLGSGILDAQGNLNVYKKGEMDTQVSTITTTVGNSAQKDFSNVTTIPAAKITGTIPVSALPDLSGTYVSSTGSFPYANLTGKPTALSQFTNDLGFLTSASLSSIPWTSITGRPTLLSGYGITDAAKNLGGVIGFLSGLESARPATAAEGTVFLATDTQKIYFSNGTTWGPIGGSTGGVSSVAVSAPLVSTGTETPVVSIPKADSTKDGYLSLTDWTNFNNKLSNALSTGKIHVGVGNIATEVTLSGDVLLNSSGVTDVSKIKGTSVSTLSPGNDQVFKFNGTSWAPENISITDIRSSSIPTNQFFPLNCSASQTMIYSAVTDSMSCASISVPSSQISYGAASANTIFAGPNGSSGSPSFRAMVANDLPSIPWSKIISTPSALSDYGITDAVANLGGTPAIRSGADAAKPASPTAGTLYIAADTQKIYQYTSGSWVLIASNGGTISQLSGDVSATGSGNVTTTVNSVGGSSASAINLATIGINSATNTNSASTIVKRDASGGFSAGAVTQTSAVLTNGVNSVTLVAPAGVSPSYTLKLPTTVGYTNQVLGASDNSGTLTWITPTISVASPLTNTSGTIGISQATSSTPGYISATDWTMFNNKLTSTLSSGNIFVGSSTGTATSMTLSGDASLNSAGSLTVTRIQNTSVSTTAPTSTSHVLKNNGSSWAPGYVGISDIRSSISGATAFPTNCLSGQIFIYNVLTDRYACTDISITAAQLSGTVPVSKGGTGSTTQNFVDLTTAQSIAGNKTFSGSVSAGSLSSSGSVSATGTLSGGSVSTTGAVSAASVTATGSISGKMLAGGFLANGNVATLDMSAGNTQTTTFNCSTNITLNNMVDGASYNVIVQDTTSTTMCSFTASGVSTWKFQPVNAARTASTHTVYSMLKAGNTVYVWWTGGF